MKIALIDCIGGVSGNMMLGAILDAGVDVGRLEPLAERCAGLRQGAQTFSTSGRPSSPVGKKISTMASIENAATSLYSMVK